MLSIRTILALSISAVLCTSATAASHVFTMSNGGTGNSVLIYNRAANGGLTLAQTVSTGGLGLGLGLGSQGALLNVSHYLLAVNAGSNTITVLNIGATRVSIASKASSGGAVPVSLTYSAGKVYVLNAGSTNTGSPGNITGFTFDDTRGALTPIAGSTQPLSAAFVGPAQVSFNRQGTALIVAEKDTSLIDIYAVGVNGVAGPPTAYASHGMTPFGFQVGTHNRFYVSEAFRGLGNVSAASSYALSSMNVPQVISGSVTTNYAAACWLVLSPSGNFAYVTDTPSNIISVFSISSTGVLTLLPGFDTFTGTATTPLDEAITVDGKNLYTLNGGNGTIGAYTVNADGSLTPIGAIGGITTPSPAGLVVR